MSLLSTSSVDRAISFCEEKDVQVVIADSNRRDEDVNEFFRAVNEIRPLTRKLVLTSFADLESTQKAINDGKINRFFTKPWEPKQLRQALIEEIDLFYEEQNKQSHNSQLDEQVEELSKKHSFSSKLAEGVTDLLDTNRLSSGVEMAGFLLEKRLPGNRARQKKVLRYVKAMTARLDHLAQKEKDQIQIAAQLYQVGMLALPADLLGKTKLEMTTDDYALWWTYPELGAEACFEETQSNEVSDIIKHHCENVNGTGFPLKLAGKFIPLGSRVLRLAIDFARYEDDYGREAAKSQIGKDANNVYDRELVDLLLSAVTAH